MSKKSKKSEKVLSDHVRKGKRFIPPLLAAMGEKHSSFSWAKDIVPEVFWISLLQHYFGLEKGIEIVLQIVLIADSFYEEGEVKPLFCKITSFEELDADQKNTIIEELEKSEALSNIQSCLAPFFDLFPESPLSFLKPEQQLGGDGKMFDLIFPDIYDRYSKVAVYTVATAAYLGLRQGKIILAGEKAEEMRDKMIEDFKAIPEYPDTDRSQLAASTFRAMVPMFILQKEEESPEVDEDWHEYFWTRMTGKGDCLVEPITNLPDVEPTNDIEKLIDRFVSCACAELEARIQKWGFNLKNIEVYEVVGGLLARQCSLAIDMAYSPHTWTAHSAHLFHRAMADVFITLSWILEKPEERSKKFIEEGIGIAKLDLEHRKKELEKRKDVTEEENKLIEFWEAWINSQRLADLVEVNVGSWSGMSVRAMAEEAGCKDFYNFVYQPFSLGAHSAWPHISTKNLQYCSNPAHRFHMIPFVPILDPDLHFFYLTAKYLNRAFLKFDEKMQITVEEKSAYDQLCKDLYGE